MNQRQLDCFLAVAECLNFSHAAKQLYLSQAAVSQQIQSLEKELGFSLFVRTRHSVELTEAGRYFYPQVAGSKAFFNAAVARAQAIAHKEQPRTIVGYDGPLAEYWVGKALKKAGAGRELSPYALRRATLPKLTAMLIDGAVDAIVTTDVEIRGISNMKFRALCSASPCVFYPRGHRFERMRYVSVGDLQGERILTAYNAPHSLAPSNTASYLQEHGVLPDTAVSVPDGDTAFMAVSIGMGIFVASHLCDGFAVRHGVESVDLQCDLDSVVLGIAWKAGSPDIDAFVDSSLKLFEDKELVNSNLKCTYLCK